MKNIINELQVIQKKKNTQNSFEIPIIMDETDIEINNILDSYLLSENNEKTNFKVSNDIAWLLMGFGFYMATYSLRSSEQRYFSNGLTAIGIASKAIDLRECLKLLPLYWDVFRKKGLSFQPVLSQNNDFSKELQKFLERDELNKTLECMGFELAGKEENIQYRQKN